MRPIMVRYGGRHVVTALAFVLVLWMTGCATPQQAAKPTATSAPQSQLSVVSDIVITEADGFVNVLISGDQPLAYTSVKQPFPPGMVLYLPSTRLENITDNLPVESALISTIKTSEIVGTSTTTRIEIKLKADTEYAVFRQGNDLRISFEKPAMNTASAQGATVETQAATETTAPDKSVTPESASPALMPATTFTGAGAEVEGDAVSVKFSANGAISEYDAFTIDNPPRIVFDIYGVGSPFKGEQVIPVNSKMVRRIRHFRYPDKVRVVIDTEEAFLKKFHADTVSDGLIVIVGAKGAAMTPVARVSIPSPTPPPPAVSVSTPAAAAKSSGEPAWVNRIDFSSEDNGKSTIIIGTTRPAKYVMNADGNKKLLLTLFDTNLPGYRQRPLITTRFESAIDRISPVQTAAMKDKSVIAIELREAVPYTIEQLDDLIMIHFDPSRVPPRPLDQAGLPDWQKAIEQVAMAASGAAASAPKGAAPAPARDAALEDVTVSEDTGAYDEKRTYYRTPSKKYTGEKIALDFYETDIKNVFRILREISGKNYAIDKDVSGKVTLSLDKPVPWDQVLDLVLRMNQLGMVYEGDIVRVATLATIKQEEQLRSEALQQAIAAKASERALTPVETGYFPINYADAARDILPHVQTIITPERGKVSVYTPTNQIIVVDTREVLNAVGEMIKELDKVTNQVLIEARVITANTNFTREFGTEFAMNTPSTGGLSVPGKMAGDYGLDFRTAGLQGGGNAGAFTLDYIKLAGTPLTIAAKLNLNETQGNTKTISAPKILTLDNKPATIKQGTSYPINKLDADGNSTTEFKDIVLELTVTPHVTQDGRISLKINVTKNDLGPTVGSNISFKVNEANTELIVDDGDTIVIGGITVTSDITGETGVPGLKDIPLLGWLFKTQSDSNTKDELLIFLTPRIVKLTK